MAPTRFAALAATTPTDRSTQGLAAPAICRSTFFGFSDIGERVLVQPDGKIVVGWQARNSVDGYGLARINP